MESAYEHGFKVVNYATASRNGEPLEAVIRARNMLPNVMARFCTVECKIRTSQRYLLSLGWNNWSNAIGLRADEPHRVAKLGTTNRHGNEEPVCPLHEAKVTKAMVHEWWAKQPFQLGLMEHEGNCDLCFLKGAGKIRRILADRPELADWWIRMEAEAEAVRKGQMRIPSTAFFRKDRPRYSVQLELAQRPGLFDNVSEADELSIACHCTD
jgi:3'-phosphoadenosine 5'-phosphosulfate sulfotransferase (PAPS reductase)/FAD synthetase